VLASLQLSYPIQKRAICYAQASFKKCKPAIVMMRAQSTVMEGRGKKHESHGATHMSKRNSYEPLTPDDIIQAQDDEINTPLVSNLMHQM
jgi:hypothetical protein